MFKKLIASIEKVNYSNSVGDLTDAEAKQLKVDLLVKSLHEMASHFGVRLKPTFLDARDEFSIVAANLSDTQVAGKLQGFAGWLNHASPRSGPKGAITALTSDSSWCKISAEGAENMLMEYAFSLECEETIPTDNCLADAETPELLAA